MDRPGSRGSVNFSYPTNTRPMSPTGSVRLTSPSPRPSSIASASSESKLVYDPNTRSFRPAAEVYAIQEEIEAAMNAPAPAPAPLKKKKKPIANTQSDQGTHLTQGTMFGRPQGTAVAALDAARTVSPAPKAPIAQPAPKYVTPLPMPASSTEGQTEAPIAAPKKKKKRAPPSSETSSEHSRNTSDTDTDSLDGYNTVLGPQLTKKPSIVREERELEEAADTPKGLTPQSALQSPEGAISRTVSPSPSPRPAAGRGHGKGQASASAALATKKLGTRSASLPPAQSSVPSPISVGKANGKPNRAPSLSPTRHAHYPNTPENPNNLMVRHEPPARSVSPRKSALKQSPSPRGPSPVDDMPGGWRNSVVSETSDASTVGTEDVPARRKKSFRVSFDDQNVTVLGQAPTPTKTDSPAVPSPQNKKGWFGNIGRGKKKEIMLSDDDDDEVMTPRPALPSFGSVREKRNQEIQQDRPLVKPAEPVEDPAGQSYDHVVGSLLAQNHAAANAANISKSREPLPPVVVSKQPGGVSSSDTEDNLSSTDDLGDESETPKVDRSEDDVETPKAEETNKNLESAGKSSKAKSNGNVPEIAFTQPTPTTEEFEGRTAWPDFVDPHMPGDFPSESESGTSNREEDKVSTTGRPSVPRIQTQSPNASSPATAGIAEPDTELNTAEPKAGEMAHAISDTIAEEEEGSDRDSVYSDAAEELSEGDGFMSLDAVVESPLATSMGSLPGRSPESPTMRHFKNQIGVAKQLSKEPAAPAPEEGWEKAQAYWKSLTKEKKLELEKAARLEAEAEADSESSEGEEPIPVPAPKPKKKKKKVVVRSPNSPTTEEPSAPPKRTSTQSQSDRMYMISPGAKAGPDGHTPTIRSSMRSAPPKPPADQGTHMRKSMRSGSMRGSMRGASPSPERAPAPQPRASILKKKGPPPAQAPMANLTHEQQVQRLVETMTANKAAAAARSSVAGKAAPVSMTGAMPALRRRGSADSDSSFKKARRSSVNGSFTMKSSMRGSAPPSRAQSPAGSTKPGRFSMRSMSPVGRNPAPGGLGARSLRDSGRGSSMGPMSRSRGEPKSSVFGFGRSKGSSKAGSAKKPAFRSSRFGDSSDEDEDYRPRPSFRSRIVDSSDDDSDAPMPMPMSMPRARTVPSLTMRASVREDTESSDLPDSDEEKKPSAAPKKANGQAPAAATSNVPTAGEKEGGALAARTLHSSGSGRGTMSPPVSLENGNRPAHQRRGSLLGILLRKRGDSASKVRKSDADSAARRDTPLERSRGELGAVKGTDSDSSPVGPGQAANWPLPPPIPADGPNIGVGRPATSDGTSVRPNGNRIERPEIGVRRTTAGSVAMDAPKTKKFKALRKMFRLDH